METEETEQVTEVTPEEAPPAKKATVEDLAKEAGTPAWAFAAAKAYHRWGIGQELTAEEYEKALKTTLTETHGVKR